MEEEADVSSLETGNGVVPRIKLGEQGFTGLKVTNGSVYEQAKRELRFPQSIQTFRKMSQDSVISAALKVCELMISRVEWEVESADDNDPVANAKAEFIEQCMHDMEHSWFDFVKELSSVYTYGFSVHEIVGRRRYRKNGSRYNDGLVGLRKLPIRSQDSIHKWHYSPDGRDLVGVEQAINTLDQSRYTADYYLVNPVIPREKFLLFRTDPYKDNPEGTSPLVSAFIAYKFRTQLEEIEANGYSRNLGGVPHMEIPAAWMSPDADDEQKAAYTQCKKIVTSLHNNEQAGLVTPLFYDPDTRNPLVKFNLLSVQNSGSQYIDETIKRYNKNILTALFADVLTLGQDQVGSFNLAGSKTNILAMAIEARLKEIQNVLNKELVPYLFRMNGWEDEELPEFCYGDLEERDLEVLSKAIQRIAAVGLVAKTAENVNEIAEMLDLPYEIDPDITQEELDILLGNPTSRAGDGMSKGMGNGTSDKVASNNTSDLNTENAA